MNWKRMVILSTVNNGDIVNALQDWIQASDSQLHVPSLKIDCQRNPREHKLMLLDNKAEVGNKTQANFAGSCGVSAICTKKEPCPAVGIHAPDGSICIVTYDQDKRGSKSVCQFLQEIWEARS